LPQVPSRHFCGREQELNEISEAFKSHKRDNRQRIVAIYGLGGVGKTQLCLSYALENSTTYRAILWITATSQQTISHSFSSIAQNLVDWAGQVRSGAVNFGRIAFDLGLGQMVSPTTGEVSSLPSHSLAIAKAVRTWLEMPNNNGWLIIFDGADDLEEINLQPFSPHVPNGDILISSRRSEAAQLGQGLEIKCLSASSSRDLLMSQSQLRDYC
jgi:hypothetical protein